MASLVSNETTSNLGQQLKSMSIVTANITPEKAVEV
jgi:hypothetical protein